MEKKFKILMIMAMSVAMFALGSVCAFAQDEYDHTVNDYNVMLNGDYVQFTDAAPVNVKGRIMVPFRVILETLGAEVDWDDATRTVTAVTDDTTIKFVVGQSDINIVKNGESSVKKMDVVPYINTANNRTYVSTRFVAESLGYTVGWDSDEATAVIVDYNKLFGNAEKDFSKIDAFMMNNKADLNAAYESLMEMAVNVTIYKDFINSVSGEAAVSKDLKLEVTADGSAVTKGGEMSMDMGLKMNLAQLIAALPPDSAGDISAEDMEIIKKLGNMEMSLYADMESGDMLFTTNVNSILGDSYGDNTWFKSNIYEIYDSMGLDLREIMKASVSGESVTVSQILKMMGEASENSMTISTYNDMSMTYDTLYAILGNENLKESNVGGKTVYTVDMSGIGDVVGMNGIKGKMVMTENGNGTYDCAFNLYMDMEGMMNISMSMDCSYDKTTKAVEKAPADAQIVDMSTIL